MNGSKMTLVDWLDDLSVRFIVNLPSEELESVQRICFQIEEAQWFYEDFVRPLDPQLPSLNLRQFCLAIFQHCPLFQGFDAQTYQLAFSQFLDYKTRVPVRGAILLNEPMDEVVLVKGWKKSANWSFPRGKINKAEKDLDCAIREVYEETGFDVRAAGLVPDDEDVKSIEVTMREQHMKLFVFRGVPMDTQFQPRTRKEISNIQWYRLSDLPTLKKLKQQHQHQEGQRENLATHANKFYMVAPFLVPLKKIISQLRKTDAAKQYPALQGVPPQELPMLVRRDVSPEEITQEKELSGTISQAPSQNDMDRLLGQLRQSKQTSREENLPEVIQQSANDSSARLRSLLNIHTNTQPAPPVQVQQQRQQQQQQRQLLDLFRQQRQRTEMPTQPTENISHNSMLPQHRNQAMPQTPLDQVFTQPEMPPSPKHLHRSHQAGSATSAPPPVFPFSPAHMRNDGTSHHRQPIPGFTVQAPPSQVLFPESHQASQLPIERSRSPAPYHQTGDLEFGLDQRDPGHAGPAVPEASKLPPPKLTANSAKLLSLFRMGGRSTVGAAEMSSDPAARPEAVAVPASQAPLHVSAANIQDRNGPQNLSASSKPEYEPPLPLASPTELGTTSPRTSVTRTPQQNTLLDLFKPQQSRLQGNLSPALAPAASMIPSAPPAELSTSQSPPHAQQDFVEQRRASSSEALMPPQPSKNTIQKRPALPALDNAPMSATVTGPLNISEQDFQQKSRNGRGHRATGSTTKSSSSAMTPGNVKILSRPGTSNGTKTLESPISASPRAGRSPRRARTDTKQAQASPRPFQPQILKRVVERASDSASRDLHMSSPQPVAPPAVSTPQILRRESALVSPQVLTQSPPSTPVIERGIVEAPSPISRQTSSTQRSVPISVTAMPVTAATSFPFDRRASQTSEQKSNLLSLFTSKPSGSVNPGAGGLTNPLASVFRSKTNTPTGTMQPSVSPMSSMPRTRLGSLTSLGSDSGLSGRQTPQTTNEKDKKFLLGFLNNVVNEGK